MTEIICFVCGFAVCAAVEVILWLQHGERPQTNKENSEPTTIQTAQARAYLRQYENFLNYSGSERGQMKLEDQD